MAIIIGIALQTEPVNKGKAANEIVIPKYPGCRTNLYIPVSQTMCPLSVWILTTLEKYLFSFRAARKIICPNMVIIIPATYILQ